MKVFPKINLALEIPKLSKREEKEFDLYFNKGAVKLYRFTVIIIFIATFFYLYLDYLSSDKYAIFWISRFVAVILIGFGFLLSFKDFGIKHLQTIANWTSIIYSIAVIFMIYMSNQSDLSYDNYYQGVNIMLVTSVPLRVRFKYFLRNAIIILAIYLLVAIFKQHLYGDKIVYLINNLFFILTTVLAVGLADYLLEVYLKNNFLKEKLLKEQNAEIIQKNEEISIQMNLVLKQKEMLEEQHRKITDSIRYAKHIQDLIIPSDSLLGKYFDYFMLFLPKDVLSGDFFWLYKKDNNLLLAVADCMGHGVPGALVSMVGVTFLNEIVKTEQNIDPAQILNKLRIRIKKAFSEKIDEKESADGMDIALVKVDFENKKIEFSGANNPLYLVRKNDAEIDVYSEKRLFKHNDLTLIELKADKMPIGKYVKKRSFTTKELQVFDDDMIYMFSDGYRDQLGGENGIKQIKTRDFKKLLCSVADKPTSEQKNILYSHLKNWMGNTKQTDDILVLGFILKF